MIYKERFPTQHSGDFQPPSAFYTGNHKALPEAMESRLNVATSKPEP